MLHKAPYYHQNCIKCSKCSPPDNVTINLQNFENIVITKVPYFITTLYYCKDSKNKFSY